MSKYRLLSRSTAGDGCWIWKGSTNACGYGTLGVIGKNSTKLAHRESYEVFCGPIPNGLSVCHTCDTPACINPMHLFLGTHAENMGDAARKKRFGDRRGEANGQSKLTADDVLLIRSSPRSSGELAEVFGVTQTRICQIRKGLGWKHVPMVNVHD